MRGNCWLSLIYHVNCKYTFNAHGVSKKCTWVQKIKLTMFFEIRLVKLKLIKLYTIFTFTFTWLSWARAFHVHDKKDTFNKKKRVTKEEPAIFDLWMCFVQKNDDDDNNNNNNNKDVNTIIDQILFKDHKFVHLKCWAIKWSFNNSNATMIHDL